MRETFTCGAKGHGELIIELDVSGALSAWASSSGVAFKDAAGATRLAYEDSKTVDANGHIVAFTRRRRR